MPMHQDRRAGRLPCCMQSHCGVLAGKAAKVDRAATRVLSRAYSPGCPCACGAQQPCRYAMPHHHPMPQPALQDCLAAADQTSETRAAGMHMTGVVATTQSIEKAAAPSRCPQHCQTCYHRWYVPPPLLQLTGLEGLQQPAFPPRSAHTPSALCCLPPSAPV